MSRSGLSTIVGREPLGGLVHDQELGFVSSARPIASICCSPPESWVAADPLALRKAREELVDRAASTAWPATPRGERIIRRCSSVESEGNSRRPCGT